MENNRLIQSLRVKFTPFIMYYILLSYSSDAIVSRVGSFCKITIRIAYSPHKFHIACNSHKYNELFRWTLQRPARSSITGIWWWGKGHAEQRTQESEDEVGKTRGSSSRSSVERFQVYWSTEHVEVFVKFSWYLRGFHRNSTHICSGSPWKSYEELL